MSRRSPLLDRAPARSCWASACIDFAFLSAAAAIGVLLGAGELLIERIMQ